MLHIQFPSHSAVNEISGAMGLSLPKHTETVQILFKYSVNVSHMQDPPS